MHLHLHTLSFLALGRVRTPFTLARVVNVRPGMLLGDLPTPAVVVELSELEASLMASRNRSGARLETTSELNDALDDWLYGLASGATSCGDVASVLVPGVVFLHCAVTSTAVRDKMDARFGSGKARNMGAVDGAVLVATTAKCLPDDLSSSPLFYLGLGLANHHIGGYYWGRSLGRGAAAAAIGVSVVPVSGALQLLWARRRRVVAAEAPADLPSALATNSNDGKRSEWCDFLQRGDRVQLVPRDAAVARALLQLTFGGSSSGSSSSSRSSSNNNINNGSRSNSDGDTGGGGVTVVGVRREGRPRGAEPIVERVWRFTS
jgi:hypothetical protein